MIAVLTVIVLPILPQAKLLGQGGYTWTEVSPSPTGSYLYDICAIAEDDIWAVGSGGTILHYDGSVWTTTASPTVDNLQGISSSFADDIWAVGTMGTIIRYSGEGAGWNTIPSSPAGNELLYDVSALPSGYAWAAGFDGNVYYFNGGSWTKTFTTSTPLRCVAALSSSDVWAGGNYRLLHGTSWSEYTPAPGGTLLGISGLAADDIWACGANNEGQALIFHYDGSTWTSQEFGTGQLWGIHARASDDVWAVGRNGKVMHYDGNTWADVSGATESDLFGVVSPSPGVVWLVGAGGLIIEGLAATPNITSLSRISGPVEAEVTVSGSHFGGARSASNVKFNGKLVSATDYTAWSDTDITVKVPEGATSGPVTVTTDFGTSNGLSFAVRPTVSSITPSRGTCGTNVSITNLAGSGFAGTPSVRLKRYGNVDIVATGVRRISSGKLTCRIPIPTDAAAGKWDVYVRNPDGQSITAKGLFRVDAAPKPPSVVSPLSTWYLAEGNTAWGFATSIAIENQESTEVEVRVTYMPKGSSNVTEEINLPANSQTTITDDHLRTLLGEKDFSTRVECVDFTKSIAVDRTMSWNAGSGEEAHSSVGVNAPTKTWYLPEGSTNWGFETWLLIQNPNGDEATCSITYMVEGKGPKSVTKTVGAHSRESFSMKEDIGEEDASIKVTSDEPVIPERAMYRNARREGHDSIGTTTPARDYYLAEGATGYDVGYTTYVLVQNPQNTPTEVTLTYMTGSGEVAGPTKVMEANSRYTVRVNDRLPAGTDVSTHVQGSQPIIAERAMYWDNGTGEACHDSIGMSAPHAAFFLPDGQSSYGVETWTLVQNPNRVEVTVEITYLTPDGKGNVTKTETIAGNSRETFNMAAHSGITGRAAIMVESKTSGKKIMVERAMYWNSRTAGTDTIGGFSD